MGRRCKKVHVFGMRDILVKLNEWYLRIRLIPLGSCCEKFM